MFNITIDKWDENEEIFHTDELRQEVSVTFGCQISYAEESVPEDKSHVTVRVEADYIPISDDVWIAKGTRNARGGASFSIAVLLDKAPCRMPIVFTRKGTALGFDEGDSLRIVLTGPCLKSCEKHVFVFDGENWVEKTSVE